MCSAAGRASRQGRMPRAPRRRPPTTGSIPAIEPRASESVSYSPNPRQVTGPVDWQGANVIQPMTPEPFFETIRRVTRQIAGTWAGHKHVETDKRARYGINFGNTPWLV